MVWSILVASAIPGCGLPLALDVRTVCSAGSEFSLIRIPAIHLDGGRLAVRPGQNANRLPQHEWSVPAAPDESAYGTEWWRRRAWAETWLGETGRFLWWELVDRWRYGTSTHET